MLLPPLGVSRCGWKSWSGGGLYIIYIYNLLQKKPPKAGYQNVVKNLHKITSCTVKKTLNKYIKLKHWLGISKIICNIL